MTTTPLSPPQSHSPASRPSRRVLFAIVAVVLGYFTWFATRSAAPHAVVDAHSAETHADETHAADTHAAPDPPSPLSTIPFVALLGAIALLPLFRKTAHWWEHNSNRFLVASGLALITLAYYAFAYGQPVSDHFSHTDGAPGIPAAFAVFKNAILVEYIPFITLLFSLYVISGGIHIRGSLVGTPSLNTFLILLGAGLASLIGTTGAAMLLIRPLLRANQDRRYVAHTVIFFIFVVCNTGGCLLPIGDPPLFLGYLRGVPFLWTINLWPMWLLANLSLAGIYFIWDEFRFRAEGGAKRIKAPENPEKFAIDGAVNFLWLVGVIFCVALFDPSRPVPGTAWHAPVFFREALMLALTALSLVTTSTETRRLNVFNYTAIVEVAALFVGIFICMQPPIQILNVYGPELGFDRSWKFFWGTGALSSFLDNAPTYVVFFETAKTIVPADAATVAGVLPNHLMAISLGAVFMGSMTYIGNGPNFMVKAIAEQNNVRMPSFFGYMFYSCCFVLPVCVIISLVFFGT